MAAAPFPERDRFILLLQRRGCPPPPTLCEPEVAGQPRAPPGGRVRGGREGRGPASGVPGARGRCGAGGAPWTRLALRRSDPERRKGDLRPALPAKVFVVLRWLSGLSQLGGAGGGARLAWSWAPAHCTSCWVPRPFATLGSGRSRPRGPRPGGCCVEVSTHKAETPALHDRGAERREMGRRVGAQAGSRAVGPPGGVPPAPSCGPITTSHRGPSGLSPECFHGNGARGG